MKPMDAQKVINHLRSISELALSAAAAIKNADSKTCWSDLDLLAEDMDAALAELGERRA